MDTDAANIALLGNYLSPTFVASSDGHGGTNVIDPPALGGVQPLAQLPACADDFLRAWRRSDR